MLRMCPIQWQDQYELTQDSVPDSMRTLLPILETIEKCTEVKKDKPIKAVTFSKSNKDKRKQEQQGIGRIQKKAKSDKFCTLCKNHGGAHTTHNTPECRKYNKDGTLKKGIPSKGSFKSSKKTESSFAQINERFEKLERSLKKTFKSSKKRSSHRDVSSDSDSE